MRRAPTPLASSILPQWVISDIITDEDIILCVHLRL